MRKQEEADLERLHAEMEACLCPEMVDTGESLVCSFCGRAEGPPEF